MQATRIGGAVLAIVGCSPLGAQTAASIPFRVDRTVVSAGIGRRLDSLLNRYAGYGFSGAVLVSRGSTLLLLKGYGYADRTLAIPNEPSTIFDLASLTKTVVGAAVLRLEADGKLSVDDPISRFVGQVSGDKASATLHHLATHTSGFVLAGSPIGDSSRPRFIEKMRQAPGETVPGQVYRYSNAGASLLAAIVEQVSGQPFEDFVRRRLFAPAGIHDGFLWEPAWSRRRAHGYVGKPGQPIADGPVVPMTWGIRGATGWLGSVGDIYRWHHALLGGLLPAAQRARFLDSTTTEAYGWHFEPHARRGAPLMSKGGDAPGTQSQLLYYANDRVTIVWANNDQRQRWRDLLNEGLSRIALGDAPEWMPPPVSPLSEARLAPFIGSFSDSAGKAVEVRNADGYLYLAGDDSLPPNAMYYPTADGRFTALPTRGLALLTLAFEGDAGGKTAQMAWSDGTVVRQYRRRK